MKKSHLSKKLLWSMGIITSALLVGCGGGGSSTPVVTDPIVTDPVVIDPVKKGVTSLFGTLGESNDKDAIAVLTIDTDNDGRYDGKEDTRLSVESKNGSFTFERIETPETETLNGQLIVTVDGYTPYQSVITLSNGKSITVDASSALSKPALKEVIKLSNLTPSARMSSVMEFGINNNNGQMHSFSRLISLSQLKAEADLPIDDGRVASYTFNTASIPTDVQTVEATMQTFDSTKPEDINNFPGTFTGTGLAGDKSAEGDVVGLESAAFDLLVLKDQNGEEIKLVPTLSKLGKKVDLSTCTSKWTRHITSAQKIVIEAWGDSDINDTGYQVPIWSNDNSQNAWQYIGVANYIADESKFEMCIPDTWGSGYLNCDSPISFTQPTLMCVNTFDQNGKGISDLSVNGRTTTGQYASGYTNDEGRASFEITDTDMSKWSFTYRGALTGWNTIDITQTPVAVTDETCSYELNVTNINNIYSYDIQVTAKEANGSPASNKYVTLRHNGYGAHSYSKGKTTDSNGIASFGVESDVDYVASYGAGEANVNIDGMVISPESADNHSYADVTVSDENSAPTGYVSLSHSILDIAVTQNIRISLSGYDRNQDTLSLTSLKLDATDVTLSNESAGAGYYYNSGSVSIASLSQGTHTITAVISDGTLSTTLSKSFEVTGNRSPIIATPISAINGEIVSYIEATGTTLKPASYTLVANIYDPDGDTFSSVMKLDGVEVNGTVDLVNGEHTLIITAKDSLNNESSQTYTFTVANLKPIIGQAGITPNVANLSVDLTLTIYAYVSDPDGDNINSVIATDMTTNQEYNLSNNGSGSYYSKVITSSTIGVVNNRVFNIIALDDATPPLQSDAKEVSVTIRDFNVLPTFTKALSAQSIALGTTVTLNVIARDAEGSRLSFVWKVDNVINATAVAGTIGEEILTLTGLTLGDHTISCTVTDDEGGVATTSAVITVYDPTQTSPLTIKTGLANLVVTLHDSADNLKMIESKITDTNGDALFNVLGQTASFSIAFDPTSVITESELWETLRSQIIEKATNYCYAPTTTAEQAICEQTDWCTISTDTTIPTSFFTLAHITDKNDNNISGTTIDTDGNGEISTSELYAGAIANLDINSDGSLSWAEIDNNSVQAIVFRDVPVRTYNFNLNAPNTNYYQDNYLCTENTNTFDINLTNASNIRNMNVSGSGYGSEYNYNSNTNIGAKTSINNYITDNTGNYAYMIDITDTNQTHYIQLLLDKTLADLQNNAYSYDALALTPSTYMDVNITQDVNNTYFSLNTYYKGIHFSSYYSYDGKYYHNNALDYIVTLYNHSTNGLYYNQTNYQDDTTLKSMYKASDYPMLDVSFNIDANQTVTFSGTDMAKVDYTNVSLYGYDNSNYQTAFGITINSFVNPTASVAIKTLDINTIFPAPINTLLTTAMSAVNAQVSVEATEFKYKTTEQIIDDFMQESYYYNSTEPTRSVSYYQDQTAINYKVVGTPTPKKVEPKQPTNPFSHKIDINKLFN